MSKTKVEQILENVSLAPSSNNEIVSRVWQRWGSRRHLIRELKNQESLHVDEVLNLLRRYALNDAENYTLMMSKLTKSRWQPSPVVRAILTFDNNEALLTEDVKYHALFFAKKFGLDDNSQQMFLNENLIEKLRSQVESTLTRLKRFFVKHTFFVKIFRVFHINLPVDFNKEEFEQLINIHNDEVINKQPSELSMSGQVGSADDSADTVGFTIIPEVQEHSKEVSSAQVHPEGESISSENKRLYQSGSVESHDSETSVAYMPPHQPNGLVSTTPASLSKSVGNGMPVNNLDSPARPSSSSGWGEVSFTSTEAAYVPRTEEQHKAVSRVLMFGADQSDLGWDINTNSPVRDIFSKGDADPIADKLFGTDNAEDKPIEVEEFNLDVSQILEEEEVIHNQQFGSMDGDEEQDTDADVNSFEDTSSEPHEQTDDFQTEVFNLDVSHHLATAETDVEPTSPSAVVSSTVKTLFTDVDENESAESETLVLVEPSYQSQSRETAANSFEVIKSKLSMPEAPTQAISDKTFLRSDMHVVDISEELTPLKVEQPAKSTEIAVDENSAVGEKVSVMALSDAERVGDSVDPVNVDGLVHPPEHHELSLSEHGSTEMSAISHDDCPDEKKATAPTATSIYSRFLTGAWSKSVNDDDTDSFGEPSYCDDSVKASSLVDDNPSDDAEEESQDDDEHVVSMLPSSGLKSKYSRYLQGAFNKAIDDDDTDSLSVTV